MLNTNLVGLIYRKMFVSEDITINPGALGNVEFDISLDGYTYLGVAQWIVNSSWFISQAYFASDGLFKVVVKNTHSTISITYPIRVDILYIKNLNN